MKPLEKLNIASKTMLFVRPFVRLKKRYLKIDENEL